jgi:hypothetical protein
MTRLVININVALLAATLQACLRIPPRPVSLVGPGGEVYAGKLNYRDGWSGILTVPVGPNGESYKGLFVVVDRTATSQSLGTVVGGGVVGSASGSSSASIDAIGTWHARGNRGSTMACTLQVGRFGHGTGTCQHSDGARYDISL